MSIINVGTGSDTVLGGAGDDTISIVVDGVDSVNGGLGTDRLSIDLAALGYYDTGGISWQGKDAAGQSVTAVGAYSSYALIDQYVRTATTNILTVFDKGRDFNLATLTFTGIEALDVSASSAVSDYDLIFVRGTGKYDGKGGVDTLFANWSTATSAITWVNDPTAASQTVNGSTISAMERLLVRTGSGNDRIDNSYAGNNTDDYIDAGAGNDYIDAGAGNDIIHVGAGWRDTVLAGEGNDTINITVDDFSEADSVNGGLGTDRLKIDLAAFDYYETGRIWWQGKDAAGQSVTAVDAYSSYALIDQYVQTATTNIMTVHGLRYSTYDYPDVAHLTFTSIEALDVSAVSASSALYDDNSKNDLIFVRGTGKYDGKGGADTLFANWSTATSAITWVNNPTATSQTINGSTISAMERLLVRTGSGNDRIDNSYAGNNTNDYIDTGTGNDTINVGKGSDTVLGGAGDDTISVVVDVVDGFNGIDSVDGGLGTDRLSIDPGAFDGFSVESISWQGKDAAGRSVTAVNVSSSYALIDQYVRTATTNILTGFDSWGNEAKLTFTGIEALDVSSTTSLYSADLIFVRGTGKYDGKGSVDAIYADLSAASTTVKFVAGSTQTYSYLGSTFANFERFLLKTGSGNDWIDGGTVAMDDWLDLGAGNDIAYGAGGNDYINGGAGNDILNGGEREYDFTYDNESDTMIGGDGNDTYYVSNSHDVVIETNADETIGGTDLVLLYTIFSAYTLGANVENGRILATDSVDLIGNSLNNVLYAGAGSNVLDGGSGTDTVSYYYASASVTVSLATTAMQIIGDFDVDTIKNVENLTGSSHADTLTGNAGNNVLMGGSGNDTLSGGAGNDTLDGGAGADSLSGGDGSDIYYVSNSLDRVVETNADAATGGTDLVYTTLAAYTLSANVENGRINTAAAANLTGNTLANVLYAGTGSNVLDGLAGTDTVSYQDATAAVTVSLATTAAQATGGSDSDTLRNIENLTGSNYADTLTGNANNNALSGGSGNDTLVGGAGNDILNGGAGADSMSGGNGSDTYYVSNSLDKVIESNASASTGGTDLVYTTLSAYTLGTNVENGRINTTTAANLIGNSLGNVLYAGASSNVLDGGTGTDTVSYYYASAGVTVSLATTAAQATGGSGSDTLRNIEKLTGSNYADTLTGNAGNNALNGGAGNDTLFGGAGNDILDGGSGADSMSGGDGNDTYYVSNSLDVVSETNADAAIGGIDLVYTSLSTYMLGTNVENGRINTSAATSITGNALGNVLHAGAGNNLLDGAAGTDLVSYYYASAGVTVSLATTAAQATGGSGSDTLKNVENLNGSSYADKLTGSSGNNALNGGTGNDVLTGGLGADKLTGGTGADRFDFNAAAETGLTSTIRDTIVDFKSSEGDKIDLLGVDANTALAGNQAFTFIGTASASAFTGDATGQLRFDATNKILYGSTDADTAAEFAIALTGVSSLSAANFVL